MIIEGLVTTQDSEGEPHVAPMGPVVDDTLQNWILRPFQSSTTFKNLRRNPRCIFHVVDDVLPVVQSVLKLQTNLKFSQNEFGWTIDSACHWYALEIQHWNTSQPRSEAEARVLAHQVMQPFWGWNRAKHAILEATILVTRLHILDLCDVQAQFESFRIVVEKTAGEKEQQAWELLEQHLQNVQSKPAALEMRQSLAERQGDS